MGQAPLAAVAFPLPRRDAASESKVAAVQAGVYKPAAAQKSRITGARAKLTRQLALVRSDARMGPPSGEDLRASSSRPPALAFPVAG